MRTNTVVMGLDDLVGSSAPFKKFDPLGLGSKATPEKLAYYRESELKHGRVSISKTRRDSKNMRRR